jgi:hypothetical protein
VCSQLLEAASIFEVCDLSCTELLERLERVERAGPSSDLVEYFHTFADVRLSFKITDNSQFQRLINLASKAIGKPVIPFPKNIRQQLESSIKRNRLRLFQEFSSNAKISLTLDYWFSSFCQSFIVIIGHFINIDWKLNEMLLKFEYIKKDHSDKIFYGVLISILDSFSIRDRILAVTMDNASNNNTLIRIFNKEFRKLVTEFDINSIFYISYLVYVIQLAVKIMMGRFKIEPKNNLIKVNWEGDKAAEEIKKAIRIARILIKVYHDQYNDLVILIKISY